MGFGSSGFIWDLSGVHINIKFFEKAFVFRIEFRYTICILRLSVLSGQRKNVENIKCDNFREKTQNQIYSKTFVLTKSSLSVRDN